MAHRIVSMHAFYTSNGRGVDGYLSHPTAPGPWPAMIIVHEWWGLEDHFRELGRRLAREGLVTLVPDLYHGAVASEPEVAARLKTSLNIDAAVTDILGAVPYLRGLPFVSEKVGVMGFCMGGGLALLAACRSRELAAAVVYFPSIYPDQDEIGEVACPLLLHYGTADSVTPTSEIERITQALDRNRKAYELFLYEGADHAFVNDRHPEFYNQAATELAWSRTLTFVERHLSA